MTRTLLVVALIGCGPVPSSSDAGGDAGQPVDAGEVKRCSRSCAGCCDGRTGQCAGDFDRPYSASACPPAVLVGGTVFCVECASGELCGRVAFAVRDLQCVPRSSRCVGCAGCCDAVNDVCHPGTEEARCGAAGAACSDCGAGMTCRAKACVTFP